MAPLPWWDRIRVLPETTSVKTRARLGGRQSQMIRVLPVVPGHSGGNEFVAEILAVWQRYARNQTWPVRGIAAVLALRGENYHFPKHK